MPKTTKVYYCIVCKKDFVTDSHFFITHKVKPIIKEQLRFSQSEVDEMFLEGHLAVEKRRLMEFEQLRKELKDMEDKIMNNFDLNMAERKGAFIAICELQSIVDKFSQSSPDETETETANNRGLVESGRDTCPIHNIPYSVGGLNSDTKFFFCIECERKISNKVIK